MIAGKIELGEGACVLGIFGGLESWDRRARVGRIARRGIRESLEGGPWLKGDQFAVDLGKRG